MMFCLRPGRSGGLPLAQAPRGRAEPAAERVGGVDEDEVGVAVERKVLESVVEHEDVDVVRDPGARGEAVGILEMRDPGQMAPEHQLALQQVADTFRGRYDFSLLGLAPPRSTRGAP